MLYVFKKGINSWPIENRFLHETEIVFCKEWVTELPQIGHTILFNNNEETLRARIIGIEWHLGNTKNWMEDGSIHIYATII